MSPLKRSRLNEDLIFCYCRNNQTFREMTQCFLLLSVNQLRCNFIYKTAFRSHKDGSLGALLNSSSCGHMAFLCFDPALLGVLQLTRLLKTANLMIMVVHILQHQLCVPLLAYQPQILRNLLHRLRFSRPLHLILLDMILHDTV